MRKTAACVCLTVAIYVAEPSQIALTTADRVRLDRIIPAGLERHGDLLPAGTNAVRLEPGTYIFRTGHDAVIDLGGKQTVRAAELKPRDKDDPSDVLSLGGKDEPPDPDAAVILKGDGRPDRVPVLTVHP